jgi:hypothetical protein
VATWRARPIRHKGPGGPILVLTAGNADYGKFYAEILRSEGLNAFDVADLASLTPALLASHDVVLLAKAPLTPRRRRICPTGSTPAAT